MSDGRGDFRFVEDEEPDGRDEELPGRPPRAGTWWPPGRRVPVRGTALLAVVALAAVAVVAGVILTHRGSGARPRSTPDSTVTLNATSGRVITLPQRTGTDPTRCPGLQCYAAPGVPAAVRAAVRARFPAATFGAGETTRLVDRAQGNPLWYRVLVVRIGTATLTVTVQAHAAGDAADGGSQDDGHAAVTYVDAPLRDWFVRLRLTDRSGTAEPFDQLSALADDARLVSV